MKKEMDFNEFLEQKEKKEKNKRFFADIILLIGIIIEAVAFAMKELNNNISHFILLISFISATDLLIISYLLDLKKKHPEFTEVFEYAIPIIFLIFSFLLDFIVRIESIYIIGIYPSIVFSVLFLSWIIKKCLTWIQQKFLGKKKGEIDYTKVFCNHCEEELFEFHKSHKRYIKYFN